MGGLILAVADTPTDKRAGKEVFSVGGIALAWKFVSEIQGNGRPLRSLVRYLTGKFITTALTGGRGWRTRFNASRWIETLDQATKPLGKERTNIHQQEFLSNVPTDSSAGREGLGEVIGDSWLRLDARSLEP